MSCNHTSWNYKMTEYVYCKGPTGATGPTGITGATGPAGPTGSSGILLFADFYRIPAANPNYATIIPTVEFLSSGMVLRWPNAMPGNNGGTAIILATVNSSGDAVELIPGTYLVTVNVNSLGKGELILNYDGADDIKTVMGISGSPTATIPDISSVVSGTFIIKTTTSPSTFLSVKVHSSNFILAGNGNITTHLNILKLL